MIERIPLSSAAGDRPDMAPVPGLPSGKSIGGRKDWSIRSGQFTDGLSAGVQVIELGNGLLSVDVLPTRGMGIWKARAGDIEVGWDSPIPRPIHPQHISLSSRNGLGWLEGFSELVCRCGLAFNGPPGTDDGARSPVESEITLHGRIANTPAHSVEAFVDEERGRIGVTGVVDEVTMFGPKLQLRSTISTEIGGTSFVIRDEITNRDQASHELELLYHVNVGPPFLEEGSTVECPFVQVSPRDDRAAEGMKTWNVCEGPTAGYAEQVYYYDLQADGEGNTLALLRNRSGELGLSLHFRKSQLPWFVHWKNTGDKRSGYVTGLEPATNLPNFKSFERQQRRVIQLEGGQTYVSEIRFEVHLDAAAVRNVREDIERRQGSVAPRILPRPQRPWSPVDDG